MAAWHVRALQETLEDEGTKISLLRLRHGLCPSWRTSARSTGMREQLVPIPSNTTQHLETHQAHHNSTGSSTRSFRFACSVLHCVSAGWTCTPGCSEPAVCGRWPQPLRTQQTERERISSQARTCPRAGAALRAQDHEACRVRFRKGKIWGFEKAEFRIWTCL